MPNKSESGPGRDRDRDWAVTGPGPGLSRDRGPMVPAGTHGLMVPSTKYQVLGIMGQALDA